MRKVFLIVFLGFCIGLNGVYLINENFQGWARHSTSGNYSQSVGALTYDMIDCSVIPAGASSGDGSTGMVILTKANSSIELPLLGSVGTIMFVLGNNNKQAISLQIFQNNAWNELRRIIANNPAQKVEVTMNIPAQTKLRLLNCQVDTANPNIRLYDLKVSSCLQPPIANAALEKSSHSFVASWETYSNALSYQLDVYKEISGIRYQMMDFEGYSGAFPPTGWRFQSKDASGFNTTNASSGAYYGFVNSSYWFQTPKLVGASVIRFKARAGFEDSTRKPGIVIQDSLATGSWNNIVTLTSNGQGTGDINTSYRSYTIALNETQGDSFIRWIGCGTGACYIDDIEIEYPGIIHHYKMLNHGISGATSCLIPGLERDTDYYYVVRAMTSEGVSPVSEEVHVKTWAYDFPTDVQVACNVGLSLNFSSGSANLSETEPSSAPYESFVPAFKRVLELQGSGPWTIDVNAFVQGYPWFIYRYANVWSSMENINGSLTIHIDANRDNLLEIQAGTGMDDSLPVMLSSFTASINPFNHIALSWISQSEQNLLGYYIYRSSNQHLAEAKIISPMIPACNSSQAQQYHFADPEALSAGMYQYWLQSCDLDGKDQFHGPLTIEMPDLSSGSPPLPFETGFSAIFPNPFSSSTEIGYQLKSSQNVQFKIYNTKGQLLRQISENSKSPGFYKAIWDGKTDAGRQCSSGVYLIVMKAGSQSYYRKLFLQK